jgi:YVTN family beta-propeller protein
MGGGESCREFMNMMSSIGHSIVAALLLAGLAGVATGDEARATPRFRGPSAMVLVDGGHRLVVANRRAGSLSVIDTKTRRVVAEQDVGGGLADIAALPDGRSLLAVDVAAGEVLRMECRDDTFEVRARVPVGPDPMRLAVAPDGRACVVASRWPRRLTFVELTDSGLEVVGTLALPFSPLAMAMAATPGGARLVVADAFGGRLAAVDVARRSLLSVRSLPAHNLRGLALSTDGKSLAIAEQALNTLARASFDDIHWGLLLGNHVRILPLDVVLGPEGDRPNVGRVLDLGDISAGAGDPSAVAFTPDGTLVVALGGVDEVALASRPGQPFRRVAVGDRPTALVTSADGSLVYAADSLGDTVSLVDVHGNRCLGSIPLGPRPAMGLVERGERLFFDARLAHDGWMSCQSCHTDGHSNGLVCDTLGDGSYGAPKRVPSLLGVGATGPWTWTGSVDRLEVQVRKSIATTMHASPPAPTDEQVLAISAYLRSLGPLSPSLSGSGGDAGSAARGREVFRSRKCDECHSPPQYTSADRYDVGLADEVGNRRFNPPSLRGVGPREPLLHDGRAETLEDLFLRHRHPRGMEFSPPEVADLVAFLKTL